MLASWLALPPWEGRSSEERPDRLSQCQHTLLVAVNSRSLGKAVLVRSCCCSPSPGLGRGHAGWHRRSWMPGSPCLWLQPRCSMEFGSVPVVQEGMPGVPRASPVPGSASAVPRGWWLSKSPTCGHGDQCWQAQELGTWDEGECRKNPNWEKTPTLQKIQTNPESPGAAGRKPQLSWKIFHFQGEKLEYCGICVVINEGLTLVISFAFPKEIKIFSCLRGPLLWKQQRASTHGFLKIYTNSILAPIHSSLLPLLPAANPPKM